MFGQFPGESSNAYSTLAGMILFNLERLPQLAEVYETEDWRFEIVDLYSGPRNPDSSLSYALS